MIQHYETEHSVIETRVSLPTDVHELRTAIDEIEAARDEWNTAPILVGIDDDAITFGFAAGTKSVGRVPTSSSSEATHE